MKKITIQKIIVPNIRFGNSSIISIPALILDEGSKYFNITRITIYRIDATDAVK